MSNKQENENTVIESISSGIGESVKLFKSVDLNKEMFGTLLLHSMPGKNESWDEFKKCVESNKVDLIICLTSIREIEKYSPLYADAIKNEQLLCTKLDYPIQDFGVPDDKYGFSEFVNSVAKRIREGSTVLIHCAGGIGRTGTVAICVLQQLGLENTYASELISKAGSRPETSEQRNLVLWHAEFVNHQGSI